MAEEQKETKEAKKTDGGKATKTLLKYLLGIALVVVGLWLVWVWCSDLLVLIKGGLGLFLILAGAITIAIAKE
jgi:uncharacterized membrane protein YiaA